MNRSPSGSGRPAAIRALASDAAPRAAKVHATPLGVPVVPLV